MGFGLVTFMPGIPVGTRKEASAKMNELVFGG